MLFEYSIALNLVLLHNGFVVLDRECETSRDSQRDKRKTEWDERRVGLQRGASSKTTRGIR